MTNLPQGSRTWTSAFIIPDINGWRVRLSELWPDGTAPWVMRWGVALVAMMGKGLGFRQSADGVERDPPIAGLRWVRTSAERALGLAAESR